MSQSRDDGKAKRSCDEPCQAVPPCPTTTIGERCACFVAPPNTAGSSAPSPAPLYHCACEMTMDLFHFRGVRVPDNLDSYFQRLGVPSGKVVSVVVVCQKLTTSEPILTQPLGQAIREVKDATALFHLLANHHRDGGQSAAVEMDFHHAKQLLFVLDSMFLCSPDVLPSPEDALNVEGLGKLALPQLESIERCTLYTNIIVHMVLGVANTMGKPLLRQNVLLCTLPDSDLDQRLHAALFPHLLPADWKRPVELAKVLESTIDMHSGVDDNGCFFGVGEGGALSVLFGKEWSERLFV
eukprot:m.152900 g.152900  ORF g.152900 m.152900 type:complete len:296 (-) comp20742_c0_seq4:1323-2210(-)